MVRPEIELMLFDVDGGVLPRSVARRLRAARLRRLGAQAVLSHVGERDRFPR